MRLVKLIAYSILGYVLYELYLGMTEAAKVPAKQDDEPAARAASGSSSRSGSRPGKRVAVEDSSGGRTTRAVGRGVVH